jgi:hypothetical protein
MSARGPARVFYKCSTPEGQTGGVAAPMAPEARVEIIPYVPDQRVGVPPLPRALAGILVEWGIAVISS